MMLIVGGVNVVMLLVVVLNMWGCGDIVLIEGVYYVVYDILGVMIVVFFVVGLLVFGLVLLLVGVYVGVMIM